jgi:hypothetical protein
MPAGSQKGFVRIVNPNVGSPYESAGATLVGLTLTDIGAARDSWIAMFDTIILLSGEAEQGALPNVLLGHNPRLSVIPADSFAELDALGPDVFRRARLIGFATPVIVPQTILTQLGYGAFNFHPGPPAYPGWAPAHFALYHRETEFGATAHVMVEQVDAGPIIGVAQFPIPTWISLMGLEGLAYAHLAQLFWRMAKSLATDPAPPRKLPVKWGGKKYTRRDYQAISDIPLDMPQDELRRQV